MGAVFGDPVLDIVRQPNPAAVQFGDRPRELLAVGDLTGALSADASEKHADFVPSDKAQIVPIDEAALASLVHASDYSREASWPATRASLGRPVRLGLIGCS